MISKTSITAITLVALYGCTLPGLIVHEGAPGVHPYGQSAVPLNYEVIEVTPSVVLQLRARADLVPETSSNRLPAVNPADVPPEYRIGPGDILFVTVWEHPELTEPSLGERSDQKAAATSFQATNLAGRALAQGRVVSADGAMYYPYVGAFKVAGLTCPQVRAYLTDNLRNVIVDPKIDVRVSAYRAHRVQVTGEVNQPGTLTLDDTPKGLLEAIDAGGGLTAEASHRQAVLVREGKSFQIDLAGLLSGSAQARNARLEPGDEIRVPDRSGDKVYVLGEVDKQQTVPLQQSTTPLIEALTVSGGLQRLRGDGSGVLVFRQGSSSGSGDVAASIYALNMGTPQGLLLAGEFPLEARDVVYVQATAFAKYNLIIEQMLPTITAAFMIDRVVDGNGY